ncbi:MAG TPA: glycosyltransferase family 2 protein [Paludibacteraceae bacterium]|jgi:glycosyltransferase involved in cell wall biosynthesis|nr:glycosyltransferase family 2 protein [Paludibacteraceae bacterium]
MKLSIITINRNNLDGLRKTVESVLSQTWKEFEYIVIDGASTDGSAEYLASQSEHFTYWVSELDNGIYNAMNKGILKAHGDYLFFLNSGDYLVNEYVLETVSPMLFDSDIIQGSEYRGSVSPEKLTRGYAHSDISFLEVYKGLFLHQASFFHRSLFDEYGLYDESYAVNGDTAFYLKTLGYGNASFKYIDVPVSVFVLGGISDVELNEKAKKIRAEEDAHYLNEFSFRLRSFCEESEKKINLYDLLHKYKFIWYSTMGLARLANLFKK